MNERWIYDFLVNQNNMIFQDYSDFMELLRLMMQSPFPKKVKRIYQNTCNFFNKRLK